MLSVTETEKHPSSRNSGFDPSAFDEKAEVLGLATFSRHPILAVGGELKAAVCLLSGSAAMLSHSLGDLTDPAQYRAYCETIGRLIREHGFRPSLVAHDLHPNYLSTRLALQLGLPTIGVQHHHAHVASVMAEQRITKPVIGICCDGVGLGTDMAAWGCEVLHCRTGGFSRVGHLEYFPLLGGDAAAIETWRPALALVQHAFGAKWRDAAGGRFEGVARTELDRVTEFARSELRIPLTSSLGRVFDAVSFLLGLCEKNTHEAAAAMALESAAVGDEVEPYPYETRAGQDGFMMSLSAAIRAIVREVSNGVSPGLIAARFHETVARMLVTTAAMSAERAGLRTLVLAGGCFVNTRLRTRVTQRLEQRRYQVVTPKRVSFGDSSLALGQAVVAAALHERSR